MISFTLASAIFGWSDFATSSIAIGFEARRARRVGDGPVNHLSELFLPIHNILHQQIAHFANLFTLQTCLTFRSISTDGNIDPKCASGTSGRLRDSRH